MSQVTRGTRHNSPSSPWGSGRSPSLGDSFPGSDTDTSWCSLPRGFLETSCGHWALGSAALLTWGAGVVTQGASPARGAAAGPRLWITNTAWQIVCDQVCHLNILVRVFSMRLGLPLPGYCEVMAVTRVTTHIYISLSRRIRIKILSPKLHQSRQLIRHRLL